MYFKRIMNSRMGHGAIVAATTAVVLASCDKDQPKPTTAATNGAVVGVGEAATPASTAPVTQSPPPTAPSEPVVSPPPAAKIDPGAGDAALEAAKPAPKLTRPDDKP